MYKKPSLRYEGKGLHISICKFVINIIVLYVFGMIVFKIHIFLFLPKIKFVCFPTGRLIIFQSPPLRLLYQVDITPYMTHGLLLMQNNLVVIFQSFSTFLFVIWYLSKTISCHLLDYHSVVDLATEWTVVSLRTQSRVIFAFCCIRYFI